MSCAAAIAVPHLHKTRLRLPAWTAEVGFVAAFYAAYETLRAMRHASASAALARGRAIDNGERWLHLNVERTVNTIATEHARLADLVGYYYATLHFVVTPMMLLWLWHRRRDTYRQWRRVLATATVVGLIVYWLLPVAPPRFALHGFTDTLVSRDVFGAGHAHGVQGLVNLYAAMPSLHVAWAFWVALAAFRTVHRPVRWVFWFYPAATTFVVIATANHFLADAAAGVVLILVAAWLVPVLSVPLARWRRESHLLVLPRRRQPAQLLRIGYQIDGHDAVSYDREPDDAEWLSVWSEYGTRLAVDDRGHGVRSESRSGL